MAPARSADLRTKVNVIKSNLHKYSVSAMCRVLNLPRSTYYYEAKQKTDESELVMLIKNIFKDSRNNYGTRKIKKELAKQDLKISRRRIEPRYKMKQEGLVSSYTVAQFKVHKESCNESKIANLVDRKFNDRQPLGVVVSDLTYVRVAGQWNYICVLVDLFNREIIGYSAGRNKDAEFVNQYAFDNLDELKLELSDYINWFNNRRIYSSLNYLTPSEYRNIHLKKVV